MVLDDVVEKEYSSVGVKEVKLTKSPKSRTPIEFVPPFTDKFRSSTIERVQCLPHRSER